MFEWLNIITLPFSLIYILMHCLLLAFSIFGKKSICLSHKNNSGGLLNCITSCSILNWTGKCLTFKSNAINNVLIQWLSSEANHILNAAYTNSKIYNLIHNTKSSIFIPKIATLEKWYPNLLSSQTSGKLKWVTFPRLIRTGSSSLKDERLEFMKIGNVWLVTSPVNDELTDARGGFSGSKRLCQCQ